MGRGHADAGIVAGAAPGFGRGGRGRDEIEVVTDVVTVSSSERGNGMVKPLGGG
jgi:hypothetical protein